MKLLLIVGNSNDVFISNMAKWLKKSMNVEIDVFCWENNNKQKVDTSWYDSVTASKYTLSLGGLTSFYTPFQQALELKGFLKDKHYDIIHCHWITAPLVLCTEAVKKHCENLFCTFWGREFALMKICGSNIMFRRYLKKFLDVVDYDVNSKSFQKIILPLFPTLKGKMRIGNLGAAATDCIKKIIDCDRIDESKQYYGLPLDKLIVQVGYSGKKLHQYIPIIKEIVQQHISTEKIHLLAPMTRGASDSYCDEVEYALRDSGYTFTQLRNRFLTDEEVGMLRCATDITLQLSSTDGFSRSIVEAFCAKSLVIYGSWLNYNDHLKAGGYKALCAESIHEAITTLNNVVNNYNNFQDMRNRNSINALRISTWADCIQDWVSHYKAVL